MEISERTALLAMTMNLSIFGIKYAAASISGSIAMKAEAFHTFADFVASLTVFLGLKIAKRRTRSFPYGLYKVENLLSVFIALVILFTGYEIVLEVIRSGSVEIENSWYALLSLAASIIITYVFSRYEKRIGMKTSSPILIADSAHIRADMLSGIIVLIAILSSLIGFQIDKIAALVVVGFIAKTGIQILIDGTKVLLDASLDYDTLSRVEKIIANTPQVVGLKDLTGRNSGRFKFIEAEIVIKTHDLDKAYLIADQIEREIKSEIRNIDQILIQYEPMQKDVMIYALPLTDDRCFVSEHFGEASSFLLASFKSTEKHSDKTEILENPFCRLERSKGIMSAEYLVKNGIDFVIVKKDFSGKGPAYVFSDANVEVIVTERETPADALKAIGLMLDFPDGHCGKELRARNE